MQILIYDCPEAPEHARYCAKFVSGGALMPVVAYRATMKEAEDAAAAFLAGEIRSLKSPKAAKPKAAPEPLPSVQTPKRTRDLDEL